MTPTSLIIVTDRGTLKAYKVNDTPTRGPSLQLVQAFDTTDAHGRYQDKLTDQAGAFPSGAAPGQMNSIAERTGIDNENDRRLCKQLADNIAEVDYPRVEYRGPDVAASVDRPLTAIGAEDYRPIVGGFGDDRHRPS